MNKELIQTEIKSSLQLAYPLIAALLAQIIMEIVNTIMLGRLSTNTLAAGGLGMAVFFTLIVLCNGIFSATGVMIARYYGAKKHSHIRHTLTQSFYLGLILSILCFTLLRFAPQFLRTIGQTPEIIELVSQFLYALSWGMPGLLSYFVLREFVTALSHTRLIMLLSLLSAPMIAGLNYILMYGKLGFKPLGIAGVGYATAFMEWFLFFALLYFITQNKKTRAYLRLHRLPSLNWHKIFEILKLGIPVSATMGLEATLFTTATTLMGYFGADALAAHQIALQCATFAFMFPLGIAQATAIRVGLNIGAGSLQKAKYAGFAGLFLGLTMALITAIFFLLFPKQIISLFIDMNEPSIAVVLPIAVSFITVMALFQLVDATQVIMNGALRGMKDTFIPMWLALFAYWGSGMFVGYNLAFTFDMGGIGLWWGLGIGVGVSAVLLLLRFIYKIRN